MSDQEKPSLSPEERFLIKYQVFKLLIPVGAIGTIIGALLGFFVRFGAQQSAYIDAFKALSSEASKQMQAISGQSSSLTRNLAESEDLLTKARGQYETAKKSSVASDLAKDSDFSQTIVNELRNEFRWILYTNDDKSAFDLQCQYYWKIDGEAFYSTQVTADKIYFQWHNGYHQINRTNKSEALAVIGNRTLRHNIDLFKRCL